MKKNIALLSLLIAFCFVSESFGQDDGLARTTPVISSTGSGTPQNLRNTNWTVVSINQNKIVLRLTKSIDCATLKDISAKSEVEDLSIRYNENDLKNLKTGIEKLITVRFDGNVLNKKVSIRLNWDLSNCDDSTEKGDVLQQSSVAKNQSKLKSTASKGKQNSISVNSQTSYLPVDYLYLHFKDRNIVPVESPKVKKSEKN